MIVVARLDDVHGVPHKVDQTSFGRSRLQQRAGGGVGKVSRKHRKDEPWSRPPEEVTDVDNRIIVDRTAHPAAVAQNFLQGQRKEGAGLVMCGQDDCLAGGWRRLVRGAAGQVDAGQARPPGGSRSPCGRLDRTAHRDQHDGDDGYKENQYSMDGGTCN